MSQSSGTVFNRARRGESCAPAESHKRFEGLTNMRGLAGPKPESLTLAAPSCFWSVGSSCLYLPLAEISTAHHHTRLLTWIKTRVFRLAQCSALPAELSPWPCLGPFYYTIFQALCREQPCAHAVDSYLGILFRALLSHIKPLSVQQTESTFIHSKVMYGHQYTSP